MVKMFSHLLVAYCTQVKKVKIYHTLPIPVKDISESMQINNSICISFIFAAKQYFFKHE